MIRKRLRRILLDRLGKIDQVNVQTFDCHKAAPADIVSALDSCPIEGGRKAVVIDGAGFLADEEDRGFMARLLPFVLKDGDDIDIIFIVHAKSVNENLPIVKAIKEKGSVMRFQELRRDEWPPYVRKYFRDKGYRIEEKAVSELILRVKGDLSLFLAEAEKLMLYEAEEKNITLADVSSLVSRPIEDNVYRMCYALFRGDNDVALSIFRDVRLAGTKAADAVLPLLGSQFRFLSDVLHLRNKGLSRAETAKELGVSEVRVKMTLLDARNITKAEADKALRDLAELDYQIKSGRIGRLDGMELFLISFRSA